jgi:hypothetical protein
MGSVLIALTYIGVGLFVIGWIVLLFVSLSSKFESHTQSRLSKTPQPKTLPDNFSKARNQIKATL